MDVPARTRVARFLARWVLGRRYQWTFRQLWVRTWWLASWHILTVRYPSDDWRWSPMIERREHERLP